MKPSDHRRPRRADRRTARHQFGTASLFRRCLEQGRDDDWQCLLARHADKIHSIAKRVIRSRGIEPTDEEVEELVQEVYLRWCRTDSTFEGFCELSFWRFVNVSVVNALLDLTREAMALKRAPRLSMPPSLGGARRSRDPEELAIREERRWRIARQCVRIGRCGGGDPRRPAQALGFVVFEGCTSKEASGRLGGDATPQWVDNLFRRLQRRLANEGIELPRRGARRPSR